MKLLILSEKNGEASGETLNQVMQQQKSIKITDKRYYDKYAFDNRMAVINSDVILFTPVYDIPSALLSGFHKRKKLNRSAARIASKFLYELRVIELAVKHKKKVVMFGDSIVLTLMNLGLKIYQNADSTSLYKYGFVSSVNSLSKHIAVGIGAPKFKEKTFTIDEKMPKDLKILLTRSVEHNTSYIKEFTKSRWSISKYGYKEPIVIKDDKLNMLFVKQFPVVHNNYGQIVLDQRFSPLLHSIITDFLKK